MTDRDADLIAQQIEFYRALAQEEQALLGDLLEDSELVRFALGDCAKVRRCLELGAGSGRWTRHLLTLADRVTAVDSSPEMHFASMRRLNSPAVDYRLADIFRYHDDSRYGLIFGGFWLSHVPESRFDTFWSLLSGLVEADGRLVFVDSVASGPGGGGSLRRLGDGREFQIVKVAHDPKVLGARLSGLGWDAKIESLTANIYRVSAQLSKVKKVRDC